MMLELMQAVVEGGTGKAARLGGMPVAGKTGTTQEISRRLVRRLHAGAGGRRLGRQRRQHADEPTSPAAKSRRASGSEFRRSGDQAQSESRDGRAAPAPMSGPSAAADSIRGRADVIDTATLEMNGRPISLFGVEPNHDLQAIRALAHFLRRREVVCAAVAEYEQSPLRGVGAGSHRSHSRGRREQGARPMPRLICWRLRKWRARNASACGGVDSKSVTQTRKAFERSPSTDAEARCYQSELRFLMITVLSPRL